MIKKTKRVADYKQLTKELPTYDYTDPEYVHINLDSDRAKDYTLDVKEGDYVKLGQKLGERKGGFFTQPIIATISGYIEGTVKKFDDGANELTCVTIRNDYKNNYHETVTDRPESVIEKMKKEEIIEIIKEKSIVGLGGSGFPTYIKFSTDYDIKHVVINAVECEPYLSSDYRLIKDQPEDIFYGLKYTMQATGAEHGVIVVKKKKKELVEVLQREKTRFEHLNIDIVTVADYYPAGWEVATFKDALGIKMELGRLPMEYGILGINVSTCASIYEALKHNLPITKRHLTVNGDAIKFPQNIRVRVGTSIRELIKLSDGYVEDEGPVELVIGGPMMGTCAPNEDAIVTPTTTSLLAFKSVDHHEEPCVRCGSCVFSCPVDIQPVNIMNAFKRNDKEALENLDVMDCIECGLCSYVCTSKIHLTDYMRKGKKLIG